MPAEEQGVGRERDQRRRRRGVFFVVVVVVVVVALLLSVLRRRCFLSRPLGGDFGLSSQCRIPWERRKTGVGNGGGLLEPRERVERRSLRREGARERRGGGAVPSTSASAPAPAPAPEQPERLSGVLQGLFGAGEAQEDEGAVAEREKG